MLLHAAESLLFMFILEILIIEVVVQPSLSLLGKQTSDNSVVCQTLHVRPIVMATLGLADIIKTM